MESSGQRILIVDDSPRLRDLLHHYLEEQGFAVLVAEDATAMSRLQLCEYFDLLAPNLMIPGEGGSPICRRLRGTND